MQYNILSLSDNEVSTFQSDAKNRRRAMREFIKLKTDWPFSIINKHKIDIYKFNPDQIIRFNKAVITYNTIAEKLNATSNDIVYSVTGDNEPIFAFTQS